MREEIYIEKLKPKGVMFDSNIIDEFLHQETLKKLPKNFEYYITDIQYDEINAIKDKIRKENLLSLFKIIPLLEVKSISKQLFGFGKYRNNFCNSRFISEKEVSILENLFPKFLNKSDKGCDLFLISEIPEKLQKYSYVLLADNKIMYFVKYDLVVEEVKIENFDIFFNKLQNLSKRKSPYLSTTNTEKYCKIYLSPKNINDLITLNGDHIPIMKRCRKDALILATARCYNFIFLSNDKKFLKNSKKFYSNVLCLDKFFKNHANIIL